MVEKRSACKVLVEKPEEKISLGGFWCRVDLKYARRTWIGFSWLRTGTNGGQL
jgi:hypothetical protein